MGEKASGKQPDALGVHPSHRRESYPGDEILGRAEPLSELVPTRCTSPDAAIIQYPSQRNLKAIEMVYLAYAKTTPDSLDLSLPCRSDRHRCHPDNVAEIRCGRSSRQGCSPSRQSRNHTTAARPSLCLGSGALAMERANLCLDSRTLYRLPAPLQAMDPGSLGESRGRLVLG